MKRQKQEIKQCKSAGPEESTGKTATEVELKIGFSVLTHPRCKFGHGEVAPIASVSACLPRRSPNRLKNDWLFLGLVYSCLFLHEALNICEKRERAR